MDFRQGERPQDKQTKQTVRARAVGGPQRAGESNGGNDRENFWDIHLLTSLW